MVRRRCGERRARWGDRERCRGQALALDDPGLLLLGWDAQGYRPVDAAAMRPGQVRTLADTSDVWRSPS